MKTNDAKILIKCRVNAYLHLKMRLDIEMVFVVDAI